MFDANGNQLRRLTATTPERVTSRDFWAMGDACILPARGMTDADQSRPTCLINGVSTWQAHGSLCRDTSGVALIAHCYYTVIVTTFSSL